MSQTRKQWTTDEIMTLIDAYREHKNLWEVRDADYKNRIRKIDAYKEMAEIFGTSVDEVQRKIKNVLTQYQRERRNYQNMKKSGAGQFFQAKWFGYNAMGFLHDKNKPRKGVQIGGEYEDSEVSDHEMETENTLDLPSDSEDADENSQLAEEVNSASRTETSNVRLEMASNAPTAPNTQMDRAPAATVSSTKTQPRPNFLNSTMKTKNKSTNNSEEPSEATQVFQMMRSVYERGQRRERDEYDVFGEMVAHQIRNLKSDYSKVTTQQQITMLLYSARMSQFSPHTLQSSSPMTSPSPLSQASFTPVPTSPSSQTMFPNISDTTMPGMTSGQQVQQYTELHTANSQRPTEESTNILQTAFTSAFGQTDYY